MTRLFNIFMTGTLLLSSVTANSRNPYLPLGEFIPDGEPYVFEDPDLPGSYRVYVYGSHDVLKEAYCGKNQVVWSAPVEDLSAWRYDGVCFESEGDILYAPDIVEYKGSDGKKLYYFYPNNQARGRLSMVAVGERPDGPFTVCNWSKTNPGMTDGILGFDPAVFQDEDGRVYGYWGFEESNCAELDPENMASVKPGTGIVHDMISNRNQEGVFRFFEASSIRKIKDKYVFIYSRWTEEGEFGLPSVNYTLAYAYSNSPMGPFTYGGTIIDCRGRQTAPDGTTYVTATPYGNTHGSIAEIGGQWYVFYHRQTGTNEFSRQAMVSPIDVEVKEGADGYVRISEAEYTSEGFAIDGLDPGKRYAAGIACHYTHPDGVRQEYPNMYYSGSYPQPVYANFEGVENPYDKRYDECPIVNNTSGSVVGYKYFNFSKLSGKRRARLIVGYVPEGVKGRMEVYLDSPCGEQNGIKIGQLRFNGRKAGIERLSRVRLKGMKDVRGKHALYFVFTSEEQGKSICRLNEFTFTK
ncbi:MAG: family 43 glycosylhydrolase [Bacteroidales bacterium]|nr:family 43 glycosylhydrolase [Bacteroidales bacterium]